MSDTPNQDDLRAEVAELEGLDIGYFLIADVTALLDEVEASRKAIADVLALADELDTDDEAGPYWAEKIRAITDPEPED